MSGDNYCKNNVMFLFLNLGIVHTLGIAYAGAKILT